MPIERCIILEWEDLKNAVAEQIETFMDKGRVTEL